MGFPCSMKLYVQSSPFNVLEISFRCGYNILNFLTSLVNLVQECGQWPNEPWWEGHMKMCCKPGASGGRPPLPYLLPDAQNASIGNKVWHSTIGKRSLNAFRVNSPEEETQCRNSSTLRSEQLIAVSSQNTHFSQVMRKDYDKRFIPNNISVIAEKIP